MDFGPFECQFHCPVVTRPIHIVLMMMMTFARLYRRAATLNEKLLGVPWCAAVLAAAYGTRMYMERRGTTVMVQLGKGRPWVSDVKDLSPDDCDECGKIALAIGDTQQQLWEILDEDRKLGVALFPTFSDHYAALESAWVSRGCDEIYGKLTMCNWQEQCCTACSKCD